MVVLCPHRRACTGCLRPARRCGDLLIGAGTQAPIVRAGVVRSSNMLFSRVHHACGCVGLTDPAQPKLARGYGAWAICARDPAPGCSDEFRPVIGTRHLGAPHAPRQPGHYVDHIDGSMHRSAHSQVLARELINDVTDIQRHAPSPVELEINGPHLPRAWLTGIAL